MKYFLLGSIAAFCFLTGCTSKTVSNANLNQVTVIPSNNSENSNINKNSAIKNSNQTITVASEPLRPADPEILKQVEQQQRETADPRDAARRAANASNRNPQPGKPKGPPPTKTW